MFYAKDGCIMWREPLWVQGTLTTLVRMFEKLVIYKNLGKTK